MMRSVPNILDSYTNTMFVFLLALCVASASANSLSRIINGKVTDTSKHPHQVSLTYTSGSHFCGGSLIAANWVLTAAHCVDATTPSAYKVDINNGQRDDDNTVRYDIAEIISHESYGTGAGAFPNDIALLRLTDSVNNREPIRLATEDQSFDGYECTISGWGYTVTQGNKVIPNILQETAGTILTNDVCKTRDYWGSNINPGHICIHNTATGSCNGDSGGPMVCDGVLAGVTSWGISGCATASPSVYTRVSFFRDWIGQNSGV